MLVIPARTCASFESRPSCVSIVDTSQHRGVTIVALWFIRGNIFKRSKITRLTSYEHGEEENIEMYRYERGMPSYCVTKKGKRKRDKGKKKKGKTALTAFGGMSSYPASEYFTILNACNSLIVLLDPKERCLGLWNSNVSRPLHASSGIFFYFNCP